MYTDWYRGEEPNEADSWGCLGTRGSPSWYGKDPRLSSPYICERTRVFDGSSEVSFGGLDYFISPSWLARSFSDARTYCQNHGADLALIKSHDINTFLHVRSSEYSGLSSYVFFGLTDQAIEGTFTWIDGTPLQYSSWKYPEPNGGNNENCASLQPSNSNMGWVDVSCNLKRPFICERYQDVPENEWSRLDGTLYYISQSSMTSYSFARRFCQAQGGDLAQPKTEEINLHLMTLAEGNSYWFGLDDINQTGTFQWIDGTPLDNNGFPAWSNGDAFLFESERCVHQKVNNGWRKLPCTSYLRFACEKPPSPRPILPVRLVAATSSPFGGDLPNASFLCLLGSENEKILTLSTRRLVRLTENITPDSYTAPGNSTNVSSVVLRQTLPTTKNGSGFFECSSVTASRMTSVPLGILLSSRELQPIDGRFTKTIYIGDTITLSVMSTTGMVGEDGIRWRKFTDVDWANIGMSSGSLSHTIQSVSVSDAGVYVTYKHGTLEHHQFSLIRLIVKECPYGRWNPPLCDRLCDSCYNGGVCHELSGTCICPPGHAGKNCLQACGMHRFGWDCEFECGPGQPLDKCAGSQICLPDPYGCTCLAGYTGIYCNETCVDGMFGADCLQECHCTDGVECDDVTGGCSGDCSQEWSGPACQVPSVCPHGYFGSNCTQKCNCMNGTACLKDSGYCDEVEGRCDLGYVSDSVEFPANCMTFSGCFSSCSKTCHCSGGAEDCNFLTGNCSSSTCHPRWTGDKCQTDRFETSLEKTNPGVAIFSCSFTASPEQHLSSEYVKAAVGTLWITLNMSDTLGTTLNNSFIHLYTGTEEPIYCFIGVPENFSEFAFVRLPPRVFFVLPSFNGEPELLESGYFHAAFSWRQWDPRSDTGDGPIVGYKIYVRSGRNVVLAKEVQPPSMVNKTDRSVSKRSAENATEMVMYNASGLEPGSTYSVQIAAIRDGIKGEGEQGPVLTITTRSLPVPSTTPSPSTVSTAVMTGLGVGGVSGGSIAPAAGGAVGAILIILIIIIVVIIVFKRRRNDNPSKIENIEDRFQASADFQDTSLEENDYCGGHARSTRPKPAVAVKKPLLQETKCLDLDSTEGSPGRSSNKPLGKRQPIPVAQFPAFIENNRHSALFSGEFHDLPGPDIYPQTVAQKEINLKKNRYKNILPYDSARVKLEVIDDIPHSDYFNASYIPSFDNDKAYIASQGPNIASMDDFWRMVWQENVTTIAMVTKLKEGDKIKCRQYWPNRQGDSVKNGNIKVELVSLDACTGGIKRTMKMIKGDDYRTVTQFHFTEWPDKGVPKHTSSLLKFIKEVKADHGQFTHPLIIHCSAGVGRTGVVISIDSVVAHAKTTRMVDVFNFVTNIRQKRPFMVQTQEQYAFIYGAVLEDLLWRNTLIPVVHFTDHLQDLHSSGDGRGRSKMTKEFQVTHPNLHQKLIINECLVTTLKSLCPDPPASHTRSGRTPDNQPKNRYGNNLPWMSLELGELNRPPLSSPLSLRLFLPSLKIFCPPLPHS
ncbi:uncharacterized protein LOC100890115 [Strongylocentrotus purpuratus]|uniref:protein-tyrosine-phosphatase n=1 Tax=Strongylocentrotus purpuratus TaxID=7668 RepID=A0A7M7PIL6_STRPU|nr:uncharacterized protein LOC100890115 [Strongylocentrotus purpuratus]